MPKKKVTKKPSTTTDATKVLAMQAMLLAFIGAVVLFGIIKMVQLRDAVDASLAREVIRPTSQTVVKPSPTVKVIKKVVIVKPMPTVKPTLHR